MEQAKSKESDRQLSVEKRDAILQGAMQEFLANGYAAASMDRVASAAGVSKATVYSHFHDKESLFAALMQKMVAEKASSLFDSKRQPFLKGSPQDVLKRLAHHMTNEAAADQELQSFMRLIIGESGRFPELARCYVQIMAKPLLTILSQYLGTCPNLNIPDPEATARLFMGTMVYYVILQEVMHGKEELPMERDRIINELVDRITSSRS